MNQFELKLMRACAAGENITSSDRPSDRARTRLKRLGYLLFDRKAWKWEVTPEGMNALVQNDALGR